MVTVAEMLRRFNRVDLVTLTAEAMEQNEARIVYLNQTQLLEGKRKDGSSLGTYRPLTIQKRLEKGRQVNFVDLFDDGNFQDNMKLIMRGRDYNIQSSDWKNDMLQDKYGESIFGLSAENKAKAWQDYLRGDVAKGIARVTGAKIG